MKNEKQLVSKSSLEISQAPNWRKGAKSAKVSLAHFSSICTAAYVKRFCFGKVSITHKVCYIKSQALYKYGL